MIVRAMSFSSAMSSDHAATYQALRKYGPLIIS
jgi:hypothetical protein